MCAPRQWAHRSRTISRLMVNECLIRAIEARTDHSKSNEAGPRHAMCSGSVEERVCADALLLRSAGRLEGSTGLKNAYGNLLHDISLEPGKKARS